MLQEMLDAAPKQTPSALQLDEEESVPQKPEDTNPLLSADELQRKRELASAFLSGALVGLAVGLGIWGAWSLLKTAPKTP